MSNIPTLGESPLFNACCFDNDGYVWFVPVNSFEFVKINIYTNEIINFTNTIFKTQFSPWNLGGYLWGCCFDTVNSIWFAPFFGEDYLKITLSEEPLPLPPLLPTPTPPSNTGSTIISNDIMPIITAVLEDEGGFVGCCSSFSNIDQEHNVWLAPFNSSKFIKINATTNISTYTGGFDYGTNETIVIGHTYGTLAFSGCCFDGTYTWFSPVNSSKFVKINANTNEVIEVANNTFGTFAGCCFDGDNVWFSPGSSSKFIKMNITTDAYTEIENIYVDPNFNNNGVIYNLGAFSNCCWDERDYIWFAPSNSSKFVKINKNTNAITEIENTYGSNFDFIGCCYAGNSIWFSPNNSTKFIKIDRSTDIITEINNTYGNFGSCCFNGNSVWFAPFNSLNYLKIDVSTNEVIIPCFVPYFNSIVSTIGCCFDGDSIWFIPINSSSLLNKVSEITEKIVETITEIPLQSSLSFAPASFTACCSDNNGYVWFCPSSGLNFTKINIITNAITEISNPNPSGSSSLQGCCFDGTSVWFAPSVANIPPAFAKFLKIDVNTNEFTEISYDYDISITSNLFNGCCFDGTSIWFAPDNASNFVKINKNTNEVSIITNPYYVEGGNNIFSGCCYDNDGYVWFSPNNCTKFIKINIITNEIIEIPSFTIYTNNAYSNCCLDNNGYIWFAPLGAANFVKINVKTNVLTDISAANIPSTLGSIGPRFIDCCFDNDGYVWFAPFACLDFVKINIHTNEITNFANTRPTFAAIPAFFGGCCFDTVNSVWFAPWFALDYVKITLEEVPTPPHSSNMCRYCNFKFYFRIRH